MTQVKQTPISKQTLKRPMKLIDAYTGRLQCKVCGSEHYASIKPRSRGRYYRGSWQCSNQNCEANQMKGIRA